MISNLQKYTKDLDELIHRGEQLLYSLYNEYKTSEFMAELELKFKDKSKKEEFIKDLPLFGVSYQAWYSEGLALVKQLLSGRSNDFTRLYEHPKSARKAVTYENYVIEDALRGLTVTSGDDYLGKKKIVGPEAGIELFIQQLNIIKAIKKRFESSLFDIKQLVQADLFDSELGSAIELNKKGFVRAAGAVAGVVLEKHLAQVLDNHLLTIKKSNPGISELNDFLKKNDIYEVAIWRKIQHLGDLRNKCDHTKDFDPTKDEIDELINGVDLITKTVF